jgi:protein O-mannosyl-transferase
MSFERAHRRRVAQRKGRGGNSIAGDLIARQGWWVLPAVLALATVVAFLPTLDNGFVNWDDDRNFLNNPDYRGLGPSQLRWIFMTFPPGGHYMPMTWLTLGLDYVLWGMNPVGYHLTNLLLHVANVVVFYAIAVRLLYAARPALGVGVAGRLGGAVAAVLFAVHPLRVESVAWVTERRDVLCGLFYLLAVLVYLRACEGRTEEGLWQRCWYWAVVGLAALALLSKAMAVSLLVVLLVLDVYPLGRLGGEPAGWWGARARRVWAEKAPLAVLSLAAGVVTVAAMGRDLAIIPIAELSGLDRVAVSVYSLVFYLWKTAVPLNLSPLYALPESIEPLSWPYLIAAAIAAALSVVAVLRRRQWPWLLAVWVSYVAILLPVLAIVQTGPQLAADRYTYLAGLGWALLVGASLAAWQAKGSTQRIQARRAVILAVAGMTAAGGLGALTWRQVHVWHDPSSLWSYALATHPSAIAHYNLGVFLLGQGEVAGAMGHFQEALAARPGYAAAHNNLGFAFAQLGDLEKATAHFRQALAIDPDDAEAHGNLGNALARQGDLPEAATHLRRALAINPGDAEAHKNLGNVLALQGRLDEAIQEYGEAVRRSPADPEVYTNLGMALSRQGRRPEAIENFRRALSIRPGLPEAQSSLDELLAGSSSPRR